MRRVYFIKIDEEIVTIITILRFLPLSLILIRQKFACVVPTEPSSIMQASCCLEIGIHRESKAEYHGSMEHRRMFVAPALSE